jgi:predicted NAD/FAD-binding protein
MKIAIVGGGISGLTCAWLLHRNHEITVFESEKRSGGHSNTVEFRCDDRDYRIDTGFIVYNDRTYPNFMKLLTRLGVEGVPTQMTFAVRCDRTGIEYCGSGLKGVFAQPRNLFKPSFLQMVIDILRFNRQGTQDAENADDSMTVGEYLRKNRYGRGFAQHYLLPMGAAIWSCPTGTFAEFPIRFILEFYRNHGLLSLTNRPQWYTIPGGSRCYIDRLTSPFSDRIVCGTPVQRVSRDERGVTIETSTGETRFDEVIFACHSDQALALMQDVSPMERSILSAFPYEKNEAVLHTDCSILPRSRAAWSAWNYRIGTEPETRATITYNMNILQHIRSDRTFCVTLNDTDQIDPESILSRHIYSHPLFTVERASMQAQHHRLIRNNRTSFCGAYWGNGFHEDGVNSALAVCRRFGVNGIDGATTGNVASSSDFLVSSVTGAVCA